MVPTNLFKNGLALLATLIIYVGGDEEQVPQLQALGDHHQARYGGVPDLRGPLQAPGRLHHVPVPSGEDQAPEHRDQVLGLSRLHQENFYSGRRHRVLQGTHSQPPESRPGHHDHLRGVREPLPLPAQEGGD